MPYKEYTVKDIGLVRVYKRKGLKSLRISLGNHDYIRVSVPYWLPYSSGITFLQSKKEWINKNHKPIRNIIQDGDFVAGYYYLSIHKNAKSKISSKIKDNQIYIYLTPQSVIESPKIQSSIQKIILRAMKKRCESEIIPLLNILSNKYSLDYKNVRFKPMKTRWGSCDSNKTLSLNIYLLQLPQGLIEYVLLHELTHTKIMSHSEKFWTLLSKYDENYLQKRKEIKKHKPMLISTSTMA